MRRELLDYGFNDWQILELQEGKKLVTLYGVYQLEGCALLATIFQNGLDKTIINFRG